MSSGENPFRAPQLDVDSAHQETATPAGAEVPAEVATILLATRPWMLAFAGLAATLALVLIASVVIAMVKFRGRFPPGTVIDLLQDILVIALSCWAAGLALIAAGTISSYGKKPSDTNLTAVFAAYRAIWKLAGIVLPLYPVVYVVLVVGVVLAP